MNRILLVLIFIVFCVLIIVNPHYVTFFLKDSTVYSYDNKDKKYYPVNYSEEEIKTIQEELEKEQGYITKVTRVDDLGLPEAKYSKYKSPLNKLSTSSKAIDIYYLEDNLEFVIVDGKKVKIIPNWKKETAKVYLLLSEGVQ